MKRFFQIIIVIAILFFSYQGWLKFFSKDEADPLNEAKSNEKSSISEALDKAVGTLQSSILSFINESDKQSIPVSSAQVSSSEDELINQLSSYIQARTNEFVIDVYGERSFISDSMEGWIDAALATDDYTRYTLASYSYSIIGYSQYSEISFEFKYRETEEQSDYVRSYVKQLLAENQVAQLNAHEKIKWIHDWIVTHVQYDQTLTRYTAYEALTEQLAVCQGYALLGQMMLEEAGIEAKIAEGEVNTGSHAWNMIKLDDIWYHIDFTWDDPVGQSEEEISYQYYLVSDDTLKRDHTWTRQYPTASIDYKDVLKHAIETADSNDYKEALKQFQRSLQLHWYEPEYTIANKQALTEVIVEMTKNKEYEKSFRYLASDTLISDLKDAFQKTNPSLSYNVQYMPFKEDGASLVTVNVTYN